MVKMKQITRSDLISEIENCKECIFLQGNYCVHNLNNHKCDKRCSKRNFCSKRKRCKLFQAWKINLKNFENGVLE